MKDDTFFYNEEIFKTGDLISCHFDRTTINEAKIYICSQWEKEQVTRYHHNFVVIVFICNNIVNHYINSYQPDHLGYKYIIGSGLIKDMFNPLAPWSDGMSNLKKLYIQDSLSYPIDIMIMKDKQAINQGVLKL
jgi:hypothetical protein